MIYLLENQASERLLFRELYMSDYEEWLPFFDMEDEHKSFVGLPLDKSPREQCDIWFEKCMNRYKNDEGGMNALIHKDTGKLVGQAGLLIQDISLPERHLEVGYSILPEYWGQGYATEAALKCKEYGFENNYSDHIISIINIGNTGSEIVAKKNGMQIWLPEHNYKGSAVNIWRTEREAD